VPTLVVIAGPNGSGKSTLTAAVDFEGRTNLVDPDAIARRINASRPQSVAGIAAREAIAWARTYLNEKVSFAIETTLAGKRALALLREAKARGFHIQLLFVALGNAELHVQRVQLRVLQGGQDVPEDDVRRRFHRSLQHAPAAIRLADEAVVFDNSGRKPQRMLEVRNGRITWRAARLAEWARDLAQEISEPLARG
jgi:predicted ABC-type ATPase